jgi:hypothetical protein
LQHAFPAKAQLEPQVQTGSRIAVKPRVVDPIMAGSIKKGFGRCALRMRKDASAAIMSRSDPVNVDWQAVGIKREKFFSAQGLRECLGKEANDLQLALGMSLNDSSFRAILMEEAYLQRFDSAPTLPEGAAEQTDRTYVSKGNDLPSAMGLGQFADCLTFRGTAESDAILRTAPGTKAELTAAQAMAPILGECLVEGQKVSLTPTSIRALVADGLWVRYGRNSSSALAQGK